MPNPRSVGHRGGVRASAKRDTPTWASVLAAVVGGAVYLAYWNLAAPAAPVWFGPYNVSWWIHLVRGVGLGLAAAALIVTLARHFRSGRKGAR